MAAVTNPTQITWGSLTLGGDPSTNDYRLHGPYQYGKAFANLNVAFDVIVTSDDTATFEGLCTALENEFRKRDQSFAIVYDVADAGNTTATYTFGTHVLNTLAEVEKSGSIETDTGFSRKYSCVIRAELPADDQDGLQDLAVSVDYTPGKQKSVSVQGVYTRYDGNTASAQYAAQIGGLMTPILSGVDGSATFELISQNYERDRNDHRCTFFREYQEVLFQQSVTALDDVSIVDPRFSMQDNSFHPGDSGQEINRLRRVSIGLDASVDIEQTTDLQTLWQNTLRPFVFSKFIEKFSPAVYSVEGLQVTYNESHKMISISLQVTYQVGGGSQVIEIVSSQAIKEKQEIDRTPIHSKKGLAAVNDEGWATRQRITTVVYKVLGAFSPNSRIGGRGGSAGTQLDQAGLGLPGGGGGVRRSGWNLVFNTSEAETIYMGDPLLGPQILVTQISELLIEEFNEAP